MACGRARGVKARERRIWAPYRGRCGLGGSRGRGCAAGGRRSVGGCGWPLSLLSVAGVTHALWNKQVTTGVTRVGLLFTRGELTCCSRARMLGVNCRLLPRVGCVDEIGVGIR